MSDSKSEDKASRPQYGAHPMMCTCPTCVPLLYEPPQDTSLDDIIQKMLVDYTAWVNGEPVPWNVKKKEAIQSINLWHTAEIAKLFEQIRSEVIGKYEEPGMNTDHILSVDNRNKLRKQQREALTRLEKS